jgi:RNA polymerase sigma-70 factor (ECF subfamily)
MDSGESHKKTGNGPGRIDGPEQASLPRTVREGVCSRDPEALGALFDHHIGGLFNLAYRLLGEKMAAEDAVQEVFLRVYRSAAQYDPSRDPRPWLTAIAYNVCRDYWRSRGHRMMRGSKSLDPADHKDEELLVDDRCPEGELLEAERDEALMSGLRKLPEDQCAVVVLHDFHGLTHEEIAKIVEAEPTTVRKRYSRALSRLHGLLKGALP